MNTRLSGWTVAGILLAMLIGTIHAYASQVLPPPRRAHPLRLETITPPTDYSPQQLQYARAFMLALHHQARRGRLVLCEPGEHRDHK